MSQTRSIFSLTHFNKRSAARSSRISHKLIIKIDIRIPVNTAVRPLKSPDGEKVRDRTVSQQFSKHMIAKNTYVLKNPHVRTLRIITVNTLDKAGTFAAYANALENRFVNRSSAWFIKKQNCQMQTF